MRKYHCFVVQKVQQLDYLLKLYVFKPSKSFGCLEKLCPYFEEVVFFFEALHEFLFHLEVIDHLQAFIILKVMELLMVGATAKLQVISDSLVKVQVQAQVQAQLLEQLTKQAQGHHFTPNHFCYGSQFLFIYHFTVPPQELLPFTLLLFIGYQ